MERNDAEQRASRKLVELLGWVRAKLETLHGATSNAYTRWSLHALIRSCDPDTNPRLRNTLEELDLFTRAGEATRPSSTEPAASEERPEEKEEEPQERR